jgi:hemoglobin
MSGQATISPYEALGGKRVLETITERFYDLMDSDPAYAELRALHAEDLGPMRQSLASFLAGWSGGPRDWFEANPGKCMMSAHSGVPVNADTARQWADAMRRAIAEAGLENEQLAEALAETLERMALSMTR